VPLSAKQESIALALAAGRSAAEAAAECGSSRRTVFRWLSESEEFRQRVAELQAELFTRMYGRAVARGERAVDRIGALIDSPNESIALAAASPILEHVPKLREAAVLQAKMAALREKLEALERGQGCPG
jgi:hypothetical protein